MFFPGKEGVSIRPRAKRAHLSHGIGQKGGGVGEVYGRTGTCCNGDLGANSVPTVRPRVAHCHLVLISEASQSATCYII